MTAIADMVPGALEPLLAAMEPPHDDQPHAFWGEPPDVATCAAWMERVLVSYQRAQEALAEAKAGVLRQEDGTVLRGYELARWRRDMVNLANRRMRRYRWLKEWRQQALQRQRPSSGTRDPNKAANGQAIRAAVRRYGLLENCYDALEAWLDDDTDETWEGLLTATAILRGEER